MSIKELDLGWKQLQNNIIKASSKVAVVGIIGGGEELQKAMAHEFGATINHPGGTSYGYATEKDAREGKVKFLKKGKGYAELGVTKAHSIKIPERSFMRTTFDKVQGDLQKLKSQVIKQIIFDGLNPGTGIARVGDAYRIAVKNAISNGEIRPELSKATIRRKGSETPLLDTGKMMNSIKVEVRDD